MVYQMALREGECFLVRRVADRGIGKNIGDSRVRGDRINRYRRFAGRGNENGNRDPRDILKIKRLRQRVRDLELRHEIWQLKQRIRDLKASSALDETEPERPVRDEYSGEEYHYDDDFTYTSPPIYDEYGDEEDLKTAVGEDDYMASDESGMVFSLARINRSIIHDKVANTVGAKIVNEIFVSENAILGGDVLADRGTMVTNDGDTVAIGGEVFPVVSQQFTPATEREVLAFHDINSPCSDYTTGCSPVEGDRNLPPKQTPLLSPAFMKQILQILRKDMTFKNKKDKFEVVDKFTNKEVPNNQENFSSNCVKQVEDNPIKCWNNFAKNNHTQEGGPPF
ncbi:hypothetical protein HanIR_Chr04g0154121 [Helianthus annuus]|nr:hypothetical protein HanIR_Chr04g0154121 [Helianthus annuus]